MLCRYRPPTVFRVPPPLADLKYVPGWFRSVKNNKRMESVRTNKELLLNNAYTSSYILNRGMCHRVTFRE